MKYAQHKLLEVALGVWPAVAEVLNLSVVYRDFGTTLKHLLSFKSRLYQFQFPSSSSTRCIIVLKRFWTKVDPCWDVMVSTRVFLVASAASLQLQSPSYRPGNKSGVDLRTLSHEAVPFVPGALQPCSPPWLAEAFPKLSMGANRVAERLQHDATGPPYTPRNPLGPTSPTRTSPAPYPNCR